MDDQVQARLTRLFADVRAVLAQQGLTDGKCQDSELGLAVGEFLW